MYCVLVSGGDFVSVYDFEFHTDLTIVLNSRATSEGLGINFEHVVTGYYELNPSCNIDITSSNVGEITTYKIGRAHV